MDDLEDEKVLIFVSRRGVMKRTSLKEFSNPRAGGIIATGVKSGDEVLDVALSSGDEEVMLLSQSGRAIRFPESQVSVMGRTAQGVKGIGLKGDDEVIALLLLRRQASVLTITDRGIGKRTAMAEFPIQNRGGLGTRAMAASDSNGRLISAMEVLDGDEIMLVGDGGRVTRLAAGEIKLQGRNTRGKKLVELPQGERIVEVTRAHAGGGNGSRGEPATSPSAPPEGDQFVLLE